MNNSAHPVILFDGICNLCNGFVQFVIKRDKAKLFHFGSLQSGRAMEIIARAGGTREYLSTVVLLDGGRLYTESEAVLKILRRLGWWRLVYGLIILPRLLRDAVYRFIARHRYRVFGRRESCMVPTPDVADRFLR